MATILRDFYSLYNTFLASKMAKCAILIFENCMMYNVINHFYVCRQVSLLSHLLTAIWLVSEEKQVPCVAPSQQNLPLLVKPDLTYELYFRVRVVRMQLLDEVLVAQAKTLHCFPGFWVLTRFLCYVWIQICR